MSHNLLVEFLTVAIVHLLAVASPGPDFAIVVKQSVTYGKKTAVFTSIGVGCGILIHVFYSLMGIGLLISKYIIVFNVVKYIGAAYLIYLGIVALRTKQQPIDLQKNLSQTLPTAFSAFKTGFLTNGLNPKATLFFLSLFTVVISHDTPVIVQCGYGLYLSLATALWFILISNIFGHHKVRQWFGVMGHWFERTMGLALLLLGIKLAITEK